MIFDAIRRKYYVNTPEEWVRQHLIRYMIEEKEVPMGRIAIEKGISVHGTKRRYDVMIAGDDGHPVMLIECKAPEIKLSQDTFEQVAYYNTVFKVPYLLISNGLKHYLARIDHSTKRVQFLPDIPAYSLLV